MGMFRYGDEIAIGDVINYPIAAYDDDSFKSKIVEIIIHLDSSHYAGCVHQIIN